VNQSIDQAVSFRPSRVEGIANVDEVRISQNVLELLSAGSLLTFSLISFGKGREISSGCIPIGELHFSKSSYADSNFVFYATPRIVIYMPSDSPTNYPESHFWRVQKILQAGGFKLYEEPAPRRTPPLLDPRPARTVVYVLAFFAFAWLYALAGFLPQPIGPVWRSFLLSNPHNPNIGLALMLPATVVPALLAFRHARTVQALAAIIAASYVLTLASEWALRQMIHPWAALEQPPFNSPFATPHRLIALLLSITAFALIAQSWRRGFLEPIAPPERGTGGPPVK